MMAAEVEIHEIKFFRDRSTQRWRGMCLCGLSKIGTEIEVMTWAAVHDLDEKSESLAGSPSAEPL